MGLWRLQQVLHDVAARHPSPEERGRNPRTALFAPMPGDQHGFGSLMVSKSFARAGWDCEHLADDDKSRLFAHLADRSYDVVGLTVSCDCHIAAIPHLITAIRSVSRNPQIRVLIGGRAINESEHSAESLGADGTAPTAQEAIALAEQLVPEPVPLQNPPV